MRRTLRCSSWQEENRYGDVNMNFNLKLGTFALGALALAAAVDAQAQVSSTTGSTSQVASPAVRGFAASSFQAPIAFGAGWGSVGVGIYAQTINGTANDPGDDSDGALGFAFGLGNPDKYVGLETQVAISSVTGANDSDFGESGTFGLKLHTNLPGGAAFAVGVVGIGSWGKLDDPDPNAPGQKLVESSVYAVATKVFGLGDYPLVATLGLGDEAFQDPDDDGANVIGALAFYPHHQISLIAEYTGRFANAAVSVAPIRSFPLTLSLGGVNLAEEHGGDAELAGSASLGFTFF